MTADPSHRKKAHQLLRELTDAADSMDQFVAAARNKPAPASTASSADRVPEESLPPAAPLFPVEDVREALPALPSHPVSEDVVLEAPTLAPSQFQAEAVTAPSYPSPHSVLSPADLTASADLAPPTPSLPEAEVLAQAKEEAVPLGEPTQAMPESGFLSSASAAVDDRGLMEEPIEAARPTEPPPSFMPVAAVASQAMEEEGPVDEIQEAILPIVAEELDELVPQIEVFLRRLDQGDLAVLPELHRQVHTLKGSLGMLGAMRLRTVAHSMETWMEEVVAGTRSSSEGVDRVLSLFEGLKERLSALFGRVQEQAMGSPDHAPSSLAAPRPVPAPRLVRVSAQEIDRLVAENNEARLAGSSMAATAARLRAMLSELQENGQRQARVQRDLEIQAESQIQSRRAQLQESGQDFDPLEMDRFTRLQETSRFLAESVSDASDIYRELARQLAVVEMLIAEQEGAIQEVGLGLARTRLVPVDAINDRLYQVVWQSARELGKQVEFRLEAASSQGLDRVLLDRLVAPLEHILRNAVAHGIESPERRRARHKPATGTVIVGFRQEAGRLIVDVVDDGAGLDPAAIRAKAIERGLWASDRPMDEQEAADMICAPGFSTADTVSQLAGRGVGLDVVRAEVLGMGGRFMIGNQPHRGLRVSMYLPLSIASVSATAVEVAGEAFALPVETVEHTARLSAAALEEARRTNQVEIRIDGQDVSMPYSDLAPWLGLDNPRPPSSVTVLVLREGDRRIALGADRLLGISDLPLRPLGPWWVGLPGIMGAVLLSNGRAAFLVDPLRMGNLTGDSSNSSLAVAKEPVVLVVDDSITVRKVAAHFLERHGFRPVLARDGRDALEQLVDLVPDAILLDVEMPRMDGFDCARNIKENPKLSRIPIAMITSRTAEKHRRRALELGVDAYFGKPFREEDVLAWLSGHIGGQT